MPKAVTVTVNHAGREQINVAAAYGMIAVGRAVLQGVRRRLPSPPGLSGRATGALRDGASAAVYMRGTEVDGEGPNRPARQDAAGEIVAVVGLPFPGRFYDTGTAHQPARPVLGPASDEVDVRAVATQGAAEHWPR